MFRPPCSSRPKKVQLPIIYLKFGPAMDSRPFFGDPDDEYNGASEGNPAPEEKAFDYTKLYDSNDVYLYRGGRAGCHDNERASGLPCTPLIPIDLLPRVELYSPVASRTINQGSVFDKLPVGVRNNIFGRCDLEWTGKMPAVVAAMRISPAAYGGLLEMFYESNAFTLHPGNKWSLYGMSKYAAATIKNLDLVVCVCFLTDGTSVPWLNPKWYSPEKTGAKNIANIILTPAHLYRLMEPPTRFPIPLSEIHYCKPRHPALKEFLHKFPYFLTPFKSLRLVRVLITLVPWEHQGKGQEGLAIMRKMIQRTSNKLKVETDAEEIHAINKPGVELAQLWSWRVDSNTDESMDWSRVGRKAVRRGHSDWEKFINWEGGPRKPKCRPKLKRRDTSGAVDALEQHDIPDAMVGLEQHATPDPKNGFDRQDIPDELDELVYPAISDLMDGLERNDELNKLAGLGQQDELGEEGQPSQESRPGEQDISDELNRFDTHGGLGNYDVSGGPDASTQTKVVKRKRKQPPSQPCRRSERLRR